jgi:hypothetical protein
MVTRLPDFTLLGRTRFGRVAATFVAVLLLETTVGAAHAAASTPSGTVHGWGFDYYGAATAPAGLDGVTAISAGSLHSLALKADGTVVGWGYNASGQASVPSALTGVVAIAAGGSHSLALKADGTVVGWGNNGFGQAAGLTGATAIAAGASHSVALKADGTVVGWGDNGWGQSTVPSDLTGVVAIAAGFDHSLALKDDGTVVAWGANADGQATPPAGLTGVTAIAAGDYHSLALKADGTVVGWGSNWAGQADPTDISGAVAIAAGGIHSLALIPSAEPDADLDGYTVGSGADCNDGDPAIHPGVAEIANGIDDNCDGVVDEGFPTLTWYADQDADGYGDNAVTQGSTFQPTGYVADGTDCDDTSAAVNPGVAEVHQNGLNDDCDGSTLDNVAPVASTVDPAAFPEDSTKTITLTGSDADSDALTYVITTLPAHGSLFVGPGTSGNAITAINTAITGSTVTYRPDANYFGADGFAHKVYDGYVSSASHAVGLSITSVQDSTSTTYTGASNGYIGKSTATINLAGRITSSDPGCVTNRRMTFSFDKSPLPGGKGATYVVVSTVSGTSGSASVTVSTSSWAKPGTYQVVVTTAGDASCGGSVSTAVPLTLTMQTGR